MNLTILDLIAIAIFVDIWRSAINVLHHSYLSNSKTRNKFMSAPGKGKKIPIMVPPPIKRK